MISPAFYFEIASLNRSDWAAERSAYEGYGNTWFEILMEFPLKRSALSDEDVAVLKSMLAGKNISFHGATLNLSLVSLSDRVVSATIDILSEHLAIAALFDCRLFTFHAGEHPYFFERVAGPLHRSLAVNLVDLIQAARRHGSQLCIENLKNKNVYPRTSRELDAVFSERPEIGLSLDIRHACIVGEDPVAMVRSFGSQLQSVQFRADCGLSRRQVEQLFEALDDVGFTGPWIIEDPSLNEVEKSSRPMIAEAMTQLAGLIAY